MKKISDREPLIYLITGGATAAENYAQKSSEILTLIRRATEAKISLIQIREKKLSAKLLFELASEAAKITKNSETRLLVNDRADIALAAGADGVHLTGASLAADLIRARFPAGFLIGVSAHAAAEVEKAKLGGADFATFGPVFPTASKAAYGRPQGVAKLREVVETFQGFPIVALGGVNRENFADAFRAGAEGLAAIRFLSDPGKLWEISRLIREFKRE